MSEAPAEPLLTTNEAAVRLGISRRKLYGLIAGGLITTIRIPNGTGEPSEHRIEQAEIDAFISRNRQPATQPQ